MITLTPKQKKTLAVVCASAPQGAPHIALDASIENHRDVINTFLNLAGKTSDRYPALHRSLATQAKSGRALKNASPAGHSTVVDFGVNRHGGATARTWVSPTGGAVMTSASTLVVDDATNEPLAFGTHTTVGGQLTTAATSTATAKAATGKMRVMTMYHTIPAPNQPARFGLVSATRSFNLASVGQIAVNLTAPVYNPAVPTHTGLRIALNRGAVTLDADYIFTGDNQVPDGNMYLLVPFVGSVPISDTITGFDPATGQFTASSSLTITAQIYAAVTKGGGKYSSVVSPIKAASALNANVGVVPPSGGPVPTDPTTLYWNWPFASATPQATNPALAFTCDPASNYDLNLQQWVNSAFVCQFSVPVDNPISPTYQFAVCSIDTPNEASLQCYQIPDLQFWWHCLAEGTLVTREDGSKIPIEKITNRMRVRTGHGTASVGVEATTIGYHRNQGKKPDGSVFRLVTAKGRTLVLSDDHPLATPRGMLLAKNARRGDELLSVNGIDRVKSCEPVIHDGHFYNLKLVDEKDRREGVLHEAGTFVANGLLVGDVPAWQRHRKATLHNQEYMQSQLPKSLHRDYASALTDIARQP